jgi:Peptidase propeptide and YPEB domain
MRLNRPIVAAVAVAAVLAAGGAGIAYAVGGDSEEQVQGPAADQAGAAAVRAAGGGTVLEVERQDGDGSGVYEVELRRSDGSEVEVHLDASFEPVGTVADDDAGETEDADD